MKRCWRVFTGTLSVKRYGPRRRTRRRAIGADRSALCGQCVGSCKKACEFARMLFALVSVGCCREHAERRTASRRNELRWSPPAIAVRARWPDLGACVQRRRARALYSRSTNCPICSHASVGRLINSLSALLTNSLSPAMMRSSLSTRTVSTGTLIGS